jgi:threonine aldolase
MPEFRRKGKSAQSITRDRAQPCLQHRKPACAATRIPLSCRSSQIITRRNCMNFLSDHLYGVDDAVMQAIIDANKPLTSPSYGADDWTARCGTLMNDIFDRKVEMYLVGTGTAANALALSTLAQPYNAILSYCDAHIMIDECGAPEFFTGGAKIYGINEPRGKITAQGVEACLATFVRGEHNSKPAVVSVTQSSELGTVYQVDEVAAISQVAKSHGLKLHMDGARFANALAALGCSPAEATWEAGVDVLSFGTTKNGTMGVDAIVFFDTELARDFEHRRMRAGQLTSKSRFLGAQMEAYLTNDLWLRNARTANAHAARLHDGLKDLPGIRIPLGAEANQLFPIISSKLDKHLKDAGALYARWPGVGPGIDSPGKDELQIRLVSSFKTRPEDVDALIAAARAFKD